MTTDFSKRASGLVKNALNPRKTLRNTIEYIQQLAMVGSTENELKLAKELASEIKHYITVTMQT
jgi:hypothetical protein